MDKINSNTEHRKYQHLTSEERHEIEVRLKDKWSIYRILKHLSRPYNTIKNEINRGTVSLYNVKVARYNADKGKEVYLEHRQNCRRNYRTLETVPFLKYVEEKFFKDKWSLDACVGRAKATKKFPDAQNRMYEATGNIYYLQELGIQVAAFATLSIASKLLGNKINKLKEAVTDAINKTGLGGKCFVAGTLVFTTMGLTPIENITSDTMVYSFNPNTLEISEKQVEDVFVKQSSKLIDIEVNGDIIRTTLDHPFYVPKKGFTRAVDLKAGDELFTLNGEYVVIEKIQHVILEAPVNVYNFSVADFHTYFVSESQVAVHNSRCPTSANFDPGTGSKYGHSISEHGKQNGSSLADRARTGYEQHLAFENGTRTESPSVSPDQGHWLHNGKAAQVMDNAMSNPNVPKTGVYEVSIPEGIGEVIACENGVIKTYPATKARVVFNGDGTVKTAFPIR